MTVIEKNSLILAPMAGVTDYVYRGLCARFGAEATVTEMVSAKGYLLTPKERLDVIQLRQTNPGEHCALQIFGSDADFMARAAERLCESRFFALDINMGCPAPKIVSGGDGSASSASPRPPTAPISPQSTAAQPSRIVPTSLAISSRACSISWKRFSFMPE